MPPYELPNLNKRFYEKELSNKSKEAKKHIKMTLVKFRFLNVNVVKKGDENEKGIVV